MNARPKCIFSFTLLFSVSLLFISSQGCSPVADPHKGGLFGYSPELYEQRAAEKKEKLKQLEDEGARAKSQQSKMNTDLVAQKKALAQIKEKTAALEADLNKLRTTLSDQQQSTTAAKKKKQELIQHLAALEKESQELHTNDLSLAKKQERIEELEREKKRLQEEAELLSTMY